MITVLFVIQIVLAVILTILVLLQKSTSIGLGAYSGSNESVFGAKGPAGFLVKATFTVGFAFLLNTVMLGYMYNKTYNQSIVDDIKVQKQSPVPTPPAVPAAPAATPKAPAEPASK